MLSDQIKGNIDVLLVSETKNDESFTNGNFLIDGFSTPYRSDRNSNGGGLMLFVRKDIPSNLVLILGDFNIEVDDQNMKNFCDSYSLTSLIKHPTCYKNPSHLKYIDLILTNVPRSVQTTCVIETGLSDFHLITLTVMRKSFKK